MKKTHPCSKAIMVLKYILKDLCEKLSTITILGCVLLLTMCLVLYTYALSGLIKLVFQHKYFNQSDSIWMNARNLSFPAKTLNQSDFWLNSLHYPFRHGLHDLNDITVGMVLRDRGRGDPERQQGATYQEPFNDDQYSQRLASFVNVPDTFSNSPGYVISLARNGYEYIGNGSANDNTVRCVYCRHMIQANGHVTPAHTADCPMVLGYAYWQFRLILQSPRLRLRTRNQDSGADFELGTANGANITQPQEGTAIILEEPDYVSTLVPPTGTCTDIVRCGSDERASTANTISECTCPPVASNIPCPCEHSRLRELCLLPTNPLVRIPVSTADFDDKEEASRVWRTTTTLAPRHSDFSGSETRSETFTSQGYRNEGIVRNLVENGFYLQDTGSVRCFVCGINFRGWESTSNQYPILDHYCNPNSDGPVDDVHDLEGPEVAATGYSGNDEEASLSSANTISGCTCPPVASNEPCTCGHKGPRKPNGTSAPRRPHFRGPDTRLETFTIQHYPSEGIILQLVDKGFYLQDSGSIRCSLCEVSFRRWESASNQDHILDHRCNSDVPVPVDNVQELDRPEVAVPANGSRAYEEASPARKPNRTSASHDPHFLRPETRSETFTSQGHPSDRIDQFVQKGFFLQDTGSIRCVVCGINFRRWEFESPANQRHILEHNCNPEVDENRKHQESDEETMSSEESEGSDISGDE